MVIKMELQLGRKDELWELFRRKVARPLSIYLNNQVDNQEDVNAQETKC